MASASRNKAKTQISVLKNLESAIKDALPLSDAIASIDGLQRDRDILTQQLESANKEIQHGEKQLKEKAGEVNNVLRAFEDRYCEWSKEKAALSTELQTLRQEAEKSRGEVQRGAAAQQKKYEAAQADLQSQLEKQMILGKGLKVRFEEAQSDLRNLKKDVGLYDCSPIWYVRPQEKKEKPAKIESASRK
jgi:chromosome segregation ATPase